MDIDELPPYERADDETPSVERRIVWAIALCLFVVLGSVALFGAWEIVLDLVTAP